MSETVEHNLSNDYTASHDTVSFCGYEPLNTFLNTALNATGHYSALPRAVVNGEEPYASLFRQLTPTAAQAAQHHGTVTIQPQQRRGRPPGSGTYPTAEAFLQAIRPIVQSLQQEQRYPSQQQVAALLPTRTDARQLRAWLNHFGMFWEDVRNDP